MIKVSSKITEKDHGYQKIVSEIKKTKNSYVTVGVHEGAGKYPSGEDVGEVALYNEFGTGSIPARPFMAMAIDGGMSKIDSWREEAISKIMDGTITAKKGLELIGFRTQVLVQNQIKSNTPPPNAPSTIKAKQASGRLPKKLKKDFAGRTSTLIDTGLMLRSVQYKVFIK
jgi:hypothetical protein